MNSLLHVLSKDESICVLNEYKSIHNAKVYIDSAYFYIGKFKIVNFIYNYNEAAIFASEFYESILCEVLDIYGFSYFKTYSGFLVITCLPLAVVGNVLEADPPITTPITAKCINCGRIASKISSSISKLHSVHCQQRSLPSRLLNLVESEADIP